MIRLINKRFLRGVLHWVQVGKKAVFTARMATPDTRLKLRMVGCCGLVCSALGLPIQLPLDSPFCSVARANGNQADEKANNEKTSKNEQKVSQVTDVEDPFLWLEDVTGEKALAWVKERNAKSQGGFESNPEFNLLREDLLTILDSDARIPFVTKRGDYYYNFWRDKQNERGLWRRTSLDEYRKPSPQWDVILDLDKLAKEENENWVWSGASILRPSYDRALISMSRGGADATVTREFDLEKRAFVSGGFERPEAKGGIQWIDRDSVFIYTDFGAGSQTKSESMTPIISISELILRKAKLSAPPFPPLKPST